MGAYEITAKAEKGGLGIGAKTIRFRTVDKTGRKVLYIPLSIKPKGILQVTAVKTREIRPLPHYMHVLLNIHRKRSLQAQVTDESARAGVVLPVLTAVLTPVLTVVES